MKKLTSVQRRLLEQEEKSKKAPEAPPKPQEQLEDPNALPDAPAQEDGQEGAPGAPDEIGRVQSALQAIEKLQKSAADIEAARFVIQQEYSDFTLAKKLDYIKQELVSIIGKTKEHVSRSTMNSPEAKKTLQSWLGYGH